MTRCGRRGLEPHKLSRAQDFRPNVLYCSFNSKFVLSGKAPADREWGTVDDDGNTVPCNQAMPAPAIWIPHPVDPSCWILTNDTRNLLIPTKQEENKYVQEMLCGSAHSVQLLDLRDERPGHARVE